MTNEGCELLIVSTAGDTIVEFLQSDLLKL